VPKLARWNTPARTPDRDPDAWSAKVSEIFRPYVADCTQFYDPTKTSTPKGTPEPMISWVAFPARLLGPDRLRAAENDRSEQDEYCEWSVRKKGGKIVRVTFTTEVPEYFAHLSETDPDSLVKLYRKLVDPRVKLADLRDGDGDYLPINRWNHPSRSGRIAHLLQDTNTLGAAVDLVARATVPRMDANGKQVTEQQALIACARLGDPRRHSDPQIAGAVNLAARGGAEITLADPPGLHLGRPRTAGLVTPDGTDAESFWTIERGDPEHTMRARFEVPASKKYVVGDIAIGGKPIQFGGQVAERVQVWVKAIIKPGNHKPKVIPCGPRRARPCT
jgi:hypothetical protein